MDIEGVRIHSRKACRVFRLGASYVKCIPEKKAGMSYFREYVSCGMKSSGVPTK